MSLSGCMHRAAGGGRLDSVLQRYGRLRPAGAPRVMGSVFGSIDRWTQQPPPWRNGFRLPFTRPSQRRLVRKPTHC